MRRTDVMEGAAAAGVAPSNAVYMRCLSDLCVSREHVGHEDGRAAVTRGDVFESGGRLFFFTKVS